ncbi:MAG TPA: hypothetical protein DCY00_06405 [Actinobacteria bacterium]|nr:hypothetical protein [Actinomycetota bacterium]
MKRAVIIFGEHHSGKSKTINQYFKPLVGIQERQKQFYIKEKFGYILSQSMEEKENLEKVKIVDKKYLDEVNEMINKYVGYDLLIVATRSEEESYSLKKPVQEVLRKNEYFVNCIEILKGMDEEYYRMKANNIYALLDI